MNKHVFLLWGLIVGISSFGVVHAAESPNEASMNTPDESDSEENNDNKCTICLEQMEQGAIKTLECGHRFDEACVNAWFLLNNTCPLCRALASDSSLTAESSNEGPRVPFLRFFLNREERGFRETFFDFFNELKYSMSLPFFRNSVIAFGIKLYAFRHLMPPNALCNTTGPFFERIKRGFLKELFFGKTRVVAMGTFMLCSFLSYTMLKNRNVQEARPLLTRRQVRILNLIQHGAAGIISLEILLLFVYSKLIKKMPAQEFKILMAGGLFENALWGVASIKIGGWLMNEFVNNH